MPLMIAQYVDKANTRLLDMMRCDHPEHTSNLSFADLTAIVKFETKDIKMASRPLAVVRKHFASIDSTNSWARLNAATFDASSLTVVTADDQTAGRGRGGRVWKSIPGEDIKATFAFQLPEARVPTAYQLSPFLAVIATRALRAFGIHAQIKWPNDLLLANVRKFAGILCELEAVGRAHWAILGIGVNVNSVRLGNARCVITHIRCVLAADA
jgi:biotin-[acetyl-CoA-carboxylase] ligase BirA-like protein